VSASGASRQPPNGTSAASGRGGFQAAKEGWLKTVASYPNLSGADNAVAIVLATYLNSRTQEAWPSLETLARDTNRVPSTVWRAVQRLERMKLIEVRRARGRTKSNRYRPRFGELDCDPKTLRRRKKNPANSQ